MSFGGDAGSFDTSRCGGPALDAQYDATGSRLATAHADGVVRLWGAERHEALAELRGHGASAVSALSWATLGNVTLLASGSADGQVIISREMRPGDWQAVHRQYVTGSVSSLAFGGTTQPAELAVAGTDELGVVTMITRRVRGPGSEDWHATPFTAHAGGVVALSWAPAISPATLATGPAVARSVKRQCPRRFATAGADRSLAVWRFMDPGNIWVKQHELPVETCHSSDLRDVAWRPHAGLPNACIASCADDGTVGIWVQDIEGLDWRLQTSWAVDGDPRRLAWSKTGALLSVSVGDSGSSIYKEVAGGKWEEVGRLE